MAQLSWDLRRLTEAGLDLPPPAAQSSQECPGPALTYLIELGVQGLLPNAGLVFRFLSHIWMQETGEDGVRLGVVLQR